MTPQNQLPPEPKTIAIRLWKIDTTLSGKTQFKLFWADGRIHMAEGESMRLWIRLLSAECCASWWWHCDGIMCILMELKRIISETRESWKRWHKQIFCKTFIFFFSGGYFYSNKIIHSPIMHEWYKADSRNILLTSCDTFSPIYSMLYCIATIIQIKGGAMLLGSYF